VASYAPDVASTDDGRPRANCQFLKLESSSVLRGKLRAFLSYLKEGGKAGNKERQEEERSLSINSECYKGPSRSSHLIL
jgi:hypothetical protein